MKFEKNGSIENNLVVPANYESFENMPIFIIYSGRDIFIDCNVTRLDALIIAEGTVYTCANRDGSVPDVDDPLRSQQLVINGAVIANTVEATRTYGAGPGVNSIVPAEIINFNPVLYQFGGSSVATTDEANSGFVSGQLDTVYIHELAPRK